MYEGSKKNGRQPKEGQTQHSDVTLVGKFTDPTKYYVCMVVLPLVLILLCHFAIYCYKDDCASYLGSLLLSNMYFVLSYVPGNFWWAFLLAVAVTTYSCIIVYLNSEIPGVDPPSPLRVKDQRTYTGDQSRMGFSYIMSIAIGITTFVFALFPSVFFQDFYSLP